MALASITDMTTKIKNEVEKEIERLTISRDMRIKQSERNRSLLADLTAEGMITGKFYDWETIEYLEVPMGSLNTEKGKKKSSLEKSNLVANMKKVRELIGGPLKNMSKSLHCSSKKLVKVTMENDGFPGVKFTYIAKLPKDAKCKIVRQKTSYSSASLVCEL